MYSIVKKLQFCYGHRIQNHDGPCKNLHGHNVTVDVVLSGPLNQFGMVHDFADVKATLGKWIDEHLDHRMVLNGNDPLVAALKEAKQPVFSMDAEPSAENLAKLLFDQAKSLHLPVTEIRVWESPGAYGSFKQDG